MKNILITLSLLASLVMSSCGDMLYTKDDEKLSGDEFWTEATKATMDGFVNSMYFSIRKATMQDAAFLLFSGDLRCAPIATMNDVRNDNNKYIAYLASNDLNGLRQTYTGDKDYRADGIMRWKTFYEAIQQANIMIEEVERAPLSDEQIEAYKYESRFVRDFVYFLLVRNFGDVPFYTEAYNATPLPRTNMVDILRFIDSDIQDMLNNDPYATILPWTRTAASDRAVKASRGALLALKMHVNMWLAGFDSANASTYYANTVTAGHELVDGNGGSYALLPISQSSSIFRGASAESILDIAQGVNYTSGNETFKKEAVFSNQVMYSCFPGQSNARIYYTYDFMVKAYPPGDEDARVNLWYDENAYSSFQKNKEILKFKNVDTYGSNNDVTSNSGNQIVFRLADAILLYAEALAETGNDGEACIQLNKIRSRAGASEQNLSGSNLKDFIYWERVRELIGEGHYFYDLVRTGKICDNRYAFNTITRGAFNRGAWTWPISRSALDNNTKLELNLYWE